MVALVQLVAYNLDSFGYVTYVFKHLEESISKYLMMVKYPNWNTKTLKLGDIGFVQYEEIRAGIDKWFNGKEMVPYNYNTVQFINFVHKQEDTKNEYIM